MRKCGYPIVLPNFSRLAAVLCHPSKGHLSWPERRIGATLAVMLILALALTVALVFSDVQDILRRHPYRMS